jgi:hypothetical protein
MGIVAVGFLYLAAAHLPSPVQQELYTVPMQQTTKQTGPVEDLLFILILGEMLKDETPPHGYLQH